MSWLAITVALTLVGTVVWSIRLGRRAKGILPAGALIDRDPVALQPFKRDLLVLKTLIGLVLTGVVALIMTACD